MKGKRLYNEENKAVGTLNVSENLHSIGLQFGMESKLRHDFVELINNFLKRNKLKPVSSEASFRKHHNNKKYVVKMKEIDIYYKTKNPRTQRIEIKPIDSRSHGIQSKEANNEK